MHKLVILVEPLEDEANFDEMWPKFLHHSERMPGLQREATCRVENLLFGQQEYILLHELFFNSVSEIHKAMSSDEGKAAGQLLQKMTGGRMTLLVADHKEDHLENIRKYHQPTE